MSFTQLEKFIFEKAAETKLPGLSAAIVKEDKVIWAKAFGFRDLARLYRPHFASLHVNRENLTNPV